MVRTALVSLVVIITPRNLRRSVTPISLTSVEPLFPCVLHDIRLGPPVPETDKDRISLFSGTLRPRVNFHLPSLVLSPPEHQSRLTTTSLRQTSLINWRTTSVWKINSKHGSSYSSCRCIMIFGRCNRVTPNFYRRRKRDLFTFPKSPKCPYIYARNPGRMPSISM